MPNVKLEIDGRTYELSEDTLEALVGIAHRNRIGLEQAVAQAIANEKFLEDEVDSGAKLLIKKDDSVRHLDFELA